MPRLKIPIARRSHLHPWAIIAALAWTAIMAVLLVDDLARNRRSIEGQALAQARAHLNRDVALLRWVTQHGGIYVPVDAPNPRASDGAEIPNRELTAQSGQCLALIDPVRMKRQLEEEFLRQPALTGRITDARRVGFGETANAWDRSALGKLAAGAPEVSEFTRIDGRPFFNLMRPIATEEGCLKCHQSYRVGEVRAGETVSLSMASLLGQKRQADTNSVRAMAFFWILGMVGLAVGVHYRNLRDEERQVADAERIRHRVHLEKTVAERTAELRAEIAERERVAGLLRMQRDLSTNLASASHLREALEMLLDAVLSVEGIDCGGIYLIDAETGALDLMCQRGLKQEFLERSSHYTSDSPQAQLVRDGEPAYLVYSELELPMDPVKANEGLRAVAVLPVHYGDEIVAAINLATHSADSLPDETRYAIESMAAQVGAIIGRVRAQEADGELKQRILAIFDNVNDALLIHDLAGRILEVNRVAADRLSYPRESLRGMSVAELEAPEFASQTSARIDELRARGHAVFESAHVRCDGQIIPVELSSRLIDYQGAPAILSVARDITERKRSEEIQETLVKELEKKNAELEQFTYTVSHDLKSPLITIRGFVGLLEKDLAVGELPRAQDRLSRITKATETMHALLSQLLELSRIGRSIHPPERVEVGELVGEVINLMSQQLEERGARVTVSSELPVIYGDRPRIWELFQNLIDNAVKFVGEETSPRIDIGIRRDGDEMICFVRDNGQGIDARFHDRIFGLFERLNPAKAGTGVGLAAVKRIVEIHGGRVWVESDGSGCGSTFCFTLPTAGQPDEVASRAA